MARGRKEDPAAKQQREAKAQGKTGRVRRPRLVVDPAFIVSSDVRPDLYNPTDVYERYVVAKDTPLMNSRQAAGWVGQVAGFINGQASLEQQELRNMPRKFNDGDRVTFIEKGTLITDKVGTVVTFVDNTYAVEFDEHKAHLHSCNGLVPSGRGYLCRVDQLQLSTEKPKPKVSFASVIIADDKRQQIIEALEQIKQHDLIFEKWGFGQVLEKGRGVAMLFYGPPGTGKTLMGQAIADHESRKLKVIATADIESSVPGQAERNIREFFAEAKKSNDIILFDECDSLIYSREGMGPIMGAIVNELLSQLERFEGITIFTTNRYGTLDEAVSRRLALKLEFDMPTREQRIAIWQRMFPLEAPLDSDIDWHRLAGPDMTGGFIKNAVLRAVRKAACEKGVKDEDKKITMDHLLHATRLEVESMIEFQQARQTERRRHGYVVGPSGKDLVRG